MSTAITTLTSPKGQPLTLIGDAKLSPNSVCPRIEPPRGDELGPVLEMSDYELAEALRPVIFNEGKEYTVDAPNTSFVELLRADGERRTSSYTALPRSQSEQVDSSSLHAFSGIIGSDNRVVRRDNTVYPMSTVAYLALANGGYSGSGTMIGPSTALTAAHVVHNGTSWLRLPSIAPGTDRGDSTPMPFGSHGGYNVTVPGGWINNAGGDARFDYAVIEFSGYGDFPGRASGWKGLWVAPDNVVSGNRMYLYGHPSDKAQPQIWGNEGNGVLNGQYINFFMDAWYGDSGSGLYVYDTDGWPYVVGVLRGAAGAIGDNTKPNFGRRMTRDVYDFVVAYSAL
ncbi:trypsin-like serine peptidase [Nocardia sp. NPDC060249]|uniref:trypsin-like serine peptidase n=1 Tax=Nocardia sp. NPDC060249 TaxID=3347082 RepID=UPI00365CFB9F